MLKSNFIVDLKHFTKVSLISRDDISEMHLIKEKKTKNLFSAKILNINSKEFLQKISNELLYELKIMCDAFPSLFIKFRGISFTDFNQEQHPVIITENTQNLTPLQIIKNDNSDSSKSNWNDTKKLINIYAIAFAFLHLNKHNIINADLSLSNVYETSKFYPKINVFNFSKFKSIKYNQKIDFSDKQTESNDTFSFSKIVYSIITGKDLVQNEINQELFMKQIQDKSIIINERYRKLIVDCITDKKITFELILNQLKKDKNFITRKIDQKEFNEYIRFLKKSGQEKKELNKKSNLLNITYLDLNQYEIQELVHKDASISVYKIKNIENDRLFTAKVINDTKINALGELIIHSHIEHPSVTKLVGYSSYDFKNHMKSVIVTELMSNGSLGNLLQIERDGNEIPFWNDTMKLINIYGIASAMCYLHSKNIIHRDLKIGNILLDKFLLPHLSNFGHSKIVINQDSENESQQLDSHIIGNIQFMAPEVIIKDKYVKAIDVYSFGMIVYQILTKKSPFIGPLHHQIVLSSSHNNHNKLVPNAYEELIELCCNEAPKKRPTFADIVNQLKTNENFITENVNRNLYRAYVEFIDRQQLNEGKEANTNDISVPKFRKYSLEKIYDEYKKILELKAYISDDYNKINLKGYKKLDIIGQGSFGKVFTIKDEKNGKIYAAKKLSIISNSIEDFKKRIQFSREVSILSVINHPSIIKFIGYSPTNIKDKPKPVIALEYMENGSLEDLFQLENEVEQIPFWNETIKLIIIYGIASSMCYLHSKNIIHRDLKPGNILLDEFLFPHLTDFGLSKFLNQSDANENPQIDSYILGTIQFIAPEILSDEIYSKSSDVYSFGMIVYQIVTSKCPFAGCTETQILFKILSQKARPEFDNSIPSVYKKLISDCWHQDPSKRPQFIEIVNQLKLNQEFITQNVDKNLYNSYIEFIEQSENSEKKVAVPKEFSKYALESIKKEFKSESFLSSGEGFVDVNDFEKIDKISKNDTSQIFEVKDSKTGLKLTATVSNYIEKFNPDEIQQISQETKQLSELKHPTIQRFIGFSYVDFNHKKKPVIFNENCTQRTLFDVLENERYGEHNPDWNNTNKLIIIYGIAYGMNLLHLHEILHPNLNPKNIFIDDNFHPKLGEIGFYTLPQNSSKASSRSSAQISFSQVYLAPEVLSSDKKTPKSDVYSFAFTVFEIITGEVPFENMGDSNQIYTKIVNECYRPKSEIKIPDVYSWFIEDCWLQNPDDRPSFVEIINELETNELFLVNNVDRTKYFDYIKYIKDQ